MNFSEWLLLEKYMNDQSAYCGECHNPLLATAIIKNSKHIFNPGQLRTCSCGQAKVWTNSIRSLPKLIEYLSGTKTSYTNGFCNDKYCGMCFSTLYPLKNGVKAPFKHSNNMDLWGCTKCSNNNILIDGFLEGKENDTEEIMQWYKPLVLILQQHQKLK